MLEVLPPIERLHLADVTRLPDWHPPLPNGRTAYAVFGYVIRHPQGPIVVDTGVGTDSPEIQEMYAPIVTPIESALERLGIAVADVRALINTHLHFDHCGQNAALAGVPTYIQRDEAEAARKPFYTIPHWADVGQARSRVVCGDTAIAPGVTLLATPGHAPGHQSVLVEGGGARAILVGQAAWSYEEFCRGVPTEDACAPEWQEAARASLERLRKLGPAELYFSHDPERHRIA